MSHLMNTYARQPVTFTHGEGAFLWDTDGKRYLDALSGIAVNTLGHAHPKFTAALSAQIGKLIHTSNVYQVREQELIADKKIIHKNKAARHKSRLSAAIKAMA